MTEKQNGSNGSSDTGNTKQCQKRISASKKWCFTLNNWTQEMLNTITGSIGSDFYVIGKEVGESGTPHLQGYINFKTKCRPMEKIKLKQIHWEKCKGTEEQNIKYCIKDGDYITNDHNKVNLYKPVKIITNLRPFQKDIVDMIEKEPDDRSIIWIFEETGNVGKTKLCKYLTMKYDAVPLEGRKNDILYCAAMFNSNVYIYDLERSMEDYVSYASIEKIKNGYYMCAKYESKPICRNEPHVFIFANFKPDVSKLSIDRWKIYTINKTYELKRIDINELDDE